MNKKYVLLITISAILGMSFWGVTIYTQAKVTELATIAARYNQFENGIPAPINIGDILYYNIHNQIAENEHAGFWTPKSYKNGWRKTLAENPGLGIVAIKQFGPAFIKTFQDSLLAQVEEMKKGRWIRSKPVDPATAAAEFKPNWLYPKDWTKDSVYQHQWKALTAWKADSIITAKNINSWSIQKFWMEQRQIIGKYEKLANVLLTLSDSELDAILHEVVWEQEDCDGCSNKRLAIKTHALLLQHGLIEKMPASNYNYSGLHDNEQIWYLGEYPLDFILLTYRASHDFKDITGPKRFLKNAKKAMGEVKKLIPGLNKTGCNCA